GEHPGREDDHGEDDVPENRPETGTYRHRGRADGSRETGDRAEHVATLHTPYGLGRLVDAEAVEDEGRRDRGGEQEQDRHLETVPAPHDADDAQNDENR